MYHKKKAKKKKTEETMVWDLAHNTVTCRAANDKCQVAFGLSAYILSIPGSASLHPSHETPSTMQHAFSFPRPSHYDFLPASSFKLTIRFSTILSSVLSESIAYITNFS